MKETKWIGESGGKASDPANWDNGVPDYRTKAIIAVSERTEIIWDLKSLGISVEMRGNPEDVVIYISGDCMVGGSYFVPDSIREHFEIFKDDTLNPDTLDRPPPGYGMFQQTTWTDGNTQANPTSDNMSGLPNNTPLASPDTVSLTNKSLTMQNSNGICATMTLTNGTLTVNLNTQVDGNVSCNTISFNAGTEYYLSVGGTFSVTTYTKGIGKLILTATTNVPAVNYNKLSFRTNGTTYTFLSGTVNIDGNFSVGTEDSSTPTVNCDTNDPTIQIAANFSFYYGAGWTHSNTATVTFDGVGDYTDSNASPINLGDVVCSTALRTLNSGIQTDDLELNGAAVLSGGANTITVNGDYTADTDASFTYGTSTMVFTGTEGSGGPGTCNLSVNSSVAQHGSPAWWNLTLSNNVTATLVNTLNVVANRVTTFATNSTFAGTDKYLIVEDSQDAHPFTLGNSTSFTALTAVGYTMYAGNISNVGDGMTFDPIQYVFVGNYDTNARTATMNGSLTSTTCLIVNTGDEYLGNTTLNTGGYSITCNGTGYSGGGEPNFSIIIGDMLGTCRQGALIANNSTITCQRARIGSDTNGGVDCWVEFGTSTWNVTKDFYCFAESTEWDKGTATINFNGNTAQEFRHNGKAHASVIYYNITISNSTTARNVTLGENTLDIDGTLSCTSTNATLVCNTYHPHINTSGNVSFASGFNITHSIGTWTFDGTTGYSDLNAPNNPRDIGTISIGGGVTGATLTLASGIKVHDCTIVSGNTFNAGGSYTIKVDADWSNSGTFTCSTSTVQLDGSTGQTITSGGSVFYNLTISNSGSADINISGDLDINRTFTTLLSSGTLRLDYGGTNPNVNTAWDVTIGDGFSVTHGTGTWTFDGTTTYSDLNAPNNTRDIGTISIGGDVTGKTLTLASGIKLLDCTITSGNTLDAGGSYTIKVDGDWSNSGTFTCSTSTVEFIGDTEQNVNPGGGAFYNLEINNTHASAHVDFTGNTDVTNDLTITDGIMDTENHTVTVTDDITISANGTILAGSSTIYCAGDWTNSNGTFTKGTSTVALNGSSATDQTITSGGNAFNNLTFNNSDGSAEIIVSGNLNVDGTFSLTDGQIDMDSNNPAINTAGNVTISSGCTLTKGTGTWTFDGQLTYTDNNATAQNIGDIVINYTLSSPALTLATHIWVKNITISANTTFASGNQDIYIQGDWSRSGTFTYGTSHVHFEGTSTISGMSGTTHKFYDVTINNGCTATTPYMVSYGSITGCLTKTGSGSMLTTYIDNDLVVDGTFIVASNSGGTACH